jgi:hypothetical protein
VSVTLLSNLRENFEKEKDKNQNQENIQFYERNILPCWLCKIFVTRETTSVEDGGRGMRVSFVGFDIGLEFVMFVVENEDEWKGLLMKEVELKIGIVEVEVKEKLEFVVLIGL